VKFRPLNRYWLLVAALTVFAVAPLTYPGFFQAHSGFLPAFNAAHLADAPDWGRAPDPARGEGKLPYLLVEWVGNPPYRAIKWGYALAFVLGALGVYAWARRWLGDKGGALAATVYTYLPWHLATVYVRGAYAEAWLWAFWPFLFWAADRLAEQQPRSTLLGIAVGLATIAATFWTQAGLAALAFPLLVAYSVTVPPQRLDLLALPLSLILPWFAASRAMTATIPFADHFLYPFQLLSAAWNFGLSVPGWEDGLPFQLGVAAVGLSLVAVALAAARRKSARNPVERPLWFWLAALLVLLVLTLPLASFLWRATRFDASLTYPWQLLALTGLPLAFLAGSVVRLDDRLGALPAWAGLLSLILLASYPYLSPRFTQVDPGAEPVAMFQADETTAPQLMILEAQIAPPTELTPTLTLTLTWQAVAPVEADYTVFVHLLDAAGDKVAQRDTRPCDNECPTNTWQPGAILVDRYELSLPPDAPPGPYRLAVGLYVLESGERAAVVGRDDKTVYLNVP
jgi:hypothetical protein